MQAEKRFGVGAVVEKICWHKDLFTLKVSADIEPFIAGQFTSLQLPVANENIARAYSIASSPEQDQLEFYFNRVAAGPLSPRLLRSQEVWQRFSRIHVVHAVSHEQDLGYKRILEQLSTTRQQLSYTPIVTREKLKTALSQRFPIIIENGTLEAQLDCKFNAAKSRVMLCGSLDMIKDTTAALNGLGLSKHRRAKPGQIISEKYW